MWIVIPQLAPSYCFKIEEIGLTARRSNAAQCEGEIMKRKRTSRHLILLKWHVVFDLYYSTCKPYIPTFKPYILRLLMSYLSWISQKLLICCIVFVSCFMPQKWTINCLSWMGWKVLFYIKCICQSTFIFTQKEKDSIAPKVQNLKAKTFLIEAYPQNGLEVKA